MRVRRVLPVAASVLVAACGGSDGSGGSVPVVSTAPTPTPSGTPSPTPSPTPSYPVFADLTGAQTFKTVCASLNLNGSPPFPNPTAPFGSGFTLAVPATKDGYRVTGDGLDLAFTAADLDPAAPAGTISYVRRIDGVQTRLTPGTPSAGGAPFDYTRGIVLTTPRGGPLVQYLCNYGVPTLATDLPSAASVAYGRVALSGVAYAVTGPGGSPRNYAITASTVTMTLEPARGRVNLRIVLLGNLLSPNGPAATETTALGTYEASAPIDLAAPSFAGTLTSSDRNVQVSTLGGWFFGPQAREAAVPLSLYAIDTATDTRISMVGRVLAAQ